MTSKPLASPRGLLSHESAKINRTRDNTLEITTSEDSSHPIGLDEVKKVAERLKLNPRRPSIANWKAENENDGFKNKKRSLEPLVETLCITEDSKMQKPDVPKFSKMNDAIVWIKQELVELRALDHDLARQLINLRDEINRIKLHKSCTEHQALLDDVTLELEEQDELRDLCDQIPFRQFTSPLRGIGITKMNLNARRFSMS